MAEEPREVAQTPANSPPSRDLLMPVMTVESSVAFDLEGKPVPAGAASPRAGPAFSACQVVYTAADSKPRPPAAIRPPTAKYGSHETLPTARPRPRLARAQSEQVDGDEPAGGGANRWGVLQAKTVGQPAARKDKRRAQIVAAVTRRLFSVKKKSEEAEKTEAAEPKAEAADDQEPEELKICARARASLKAMVSRRRRADVETQTDFLPRTVRFKEVAVETDGCAWLREERKSVATQCARVAEVVDEVYRRWWHHYGNAAPWQRWPNAVFVTQHRFVAGDDEFSDDSLDSNHEGEAKVAEGDRPCVWKVLTIASGQRFGGRPDSKVAALAAPMVTAATEQPVAAKACCCRDSIDAMQAAIDGLQRSLRKQSDRPEASCYIRFCDCRSREAERRSQATQTAVATACVATQSHEGPSEGKACSCALCRSHQKIKSFVCRWKSKCRLLDEVDLEFALTGLSQAEGVKSPDKKRVEAAASGVSLANQFPINFIEVPGPAAMPGTLKPASQALNEMLINNNNNTSKWAESHPGSKCAAVQQCYFPVMTSINGRPPVMGFVTDPESQTYFLPVLATNDYREKKHCVDTECARESSTKDAPDLFGEDGELSLPRSFPEMAAASDAIDSIVRQRIDAERKHWLQIKSIILGRECDTMSSAKEDEVVGSARKNEATKKRVTWRDYRGCGDLVEVRTLPVRYEAGPYDFRDGRATSGDDFGDGTSYGECHSSRMESVSHRENLSNNNVVPNINLTFYPFVDVKPRCDQHCRNFGSRIYLFDSKSVEKPKLFKRIFKTFDHGWEMSTSQKGKIMNMFHSRSKYYEEKLAQLSLIRERRQKGLASGSGGERPDKSYSHLASYVEDTDSALRHLAMRGSMEPCAVEERERAWDINVNVEGNCVRIGQERPLPNQNKKNCLSNQGYTSHCGLCMCIQGRSKPIVDQQRANVNLERNGNPTCGVMRVSPREIGKRTECSHVFGSRQFGNSDSADSDRDQKQVALPSKYMRHLLAVRRQIVSLPKD